MKQVMKVRETVEKIENDDPFNWSVAEWFTWQTYTCGDDLCPRCCRKPTEELCERCRMVRLRFNQLLNPELLYNSDGTPVEEWQDRMQGNRDIDE